MTAPPLRVTFREVPLTAIFRLHNKNAISKMYVSILFGFSQFLSKTGEIARLLRVDLVF